MIALVYLFFIASLIVGAVGFMTLSQATMGVGFIAGACVLAVYARVIQAGCYHQEQMDLIERAAATSETTATPISSAENP